MEKGVRKRIVGHDEESFPVILPIIDSSEIQILEPPIGKGSFGQVYKGKCRGLEVAVKVLDGIEWEDSILNEFATEVEIMTRLLHPNILLCMGACIEGGLEHNNFAIILEFMPRGDLTSILHNDAIPLSLPKKMQFAIDICKGMAWLSGQHILHRDLKPANVLIDKNWTCKICDFGLSQVQRSKEKMRDQDEAPGSVMWMAPEVLLHEDIDTKLDVYSFALVFWEIITRKELYKEYEDKDVFKEDIAIKGVRPPLDDIHPVLQDILQQSWHSDPHERPTFEDLVVLLERALIQIYLPETLCENAGEFWEKYFSGRARAGWEEFSRRFFRTLGKRNGIRVQRECLERMVCEKEGDEKLVSIESFSTLLKWFGKMYIGDSTVLDQLEKVMKAEWFFGMENSFSAEDKLNLHKEGTFMVRLNMGTGGMPIEKAPFTISRVEPGGKVIHTRVYMRDEGGFLIQVGTGVKLQDNKSESLVDFIVFIMDKEPTMFRDPCPLWPYRHIFSIFPRTKSAYEEASE